MDAAAAKGKHRHIRCENLIAQIPHFFIKVNAAGHRQDFLIAQRHQVYTQVLGFAKSNIHEVKAFFSEPVYNPSFQSVQTGDDELMVQRHHQPVHMHE